MSVWLSRKFQVGIHFYLSHCNSIYYGQLGLGDKQPSFCPESLGTSLRKANPFVLLGLAALLVDCRFPCAWMNLTIVSRASKSLSVLSTAAKPRGSCF